MADRDIFGTALVFDFAKPLGHLAEGFVLGDPLPAIFSTLSGTPQRVN
jgi:hypothetical protein